MFSSSSSTSAQREKADFSSCRGIADGAVIIVASGSSAKDFPLQQFSDVPMITMNGAISMFARTNIQPFFYACTDKSFPSQQPSLFAEAMKRCQHIASWEDVYESMADKPAGTFLPLKKATPPSILRRLLRREQGLVRSDAIWDRRARSLGFSTNMSEGFFDARTVAFLALQIAYHVGFKKVFLVGVDLNQAAGRFYENGAKSISPCGLDEHYEKRILPSLKIMADKVMGEAFEVYNLSNTSRIPSSVIPKITIEEAESLIATGRSDRTCNNGG